MVVKPKEKVIFDFPQYLPEPQASSAVHRLPSPVPHPGAGRAQPDGALRRHEPLEVREDGQLHPGQGGGVSGEIALQQVHAVRTVLQ